MAKLPEFQHSKFTLGAGRAPAKGAAETRDLAGQVNEIGRLDAVIHNAGVFLEPSRSTTADGHAKTFAVNTLAP